MGLGVKGEAVEEIWGRRDVEEKEYPGRLLCGVRRGGVESSGRRTDSDLLLVSFKDRT